MFCREILANLPGSAFGLVFGGVFGGKVDVTKWGEKVRLTCQLGERFGGWQERERPSWCLWSVRAGSWSLWHGYSSGI